MARRVRFTPAARRDLSEDLPEDVAAACYEPIRSDLAEVPWTVGKPLHPREAGRWVARVEEYRIIFRLVGADELEVIKILHRRDAYRD